MERAIAKTFADLRQKGEKAFIPFITSGDPDLETTIQIVLEMARSGADILELGIPFSDPLADGPTIQRASERALRHHYRISDFLDAVRQIRRETDIPIVLFSYFNPIFQYGVDNLAREAESAGVNGVLITDLIPEEGDDYCASLDQHELDPIFLAAPTSGPDRIEKIAGRSKGFIYLISRAGVTGEQQNLSRSIEPTLNLVRQHSNLPIAVGFGISNPVQVKAVWDIADGAVVGSAIVSQIEAGIGKRDLPATIGEYCRWLTGRQ